MAPNPQNSEPFILCGLKGAGNMTELRALCVRDGLVTLASLLMSSEPLYGAEGSLEMEETMPHEAKAEPGEM